MKLRQSPRLADFSYKGVYAYFLTSVTRRRQPRFSDDEVFMMAEYCLIEAARKYGFRLLAYCFMPDHLHALALAEDAESDAGELVRIFKQRSSYHAKRLLGDELWQISYHDRIMRCDEDLYDVAAYIWNNPVRAGLVADFRRFGRSGPRPLPDELL